MISLTGTNILSGIPFGRKICPLKSISLCRYNSGWSYASTYHTPKSTSSSTILSPFTSYGRSSSDGSMILPCISSKISCAIGFCTFSARLNPDLLTPSAHLLTTISSDSVSCSISIFLIFIRYISSVVPFTVEYTPWSSKLLGYLIESRSSSFHIPLYSMIICAGW